MSHRPVPVFSPGVADPDYWSRFDGWRDTRAEWRAELADLPEIGVRGPRSKRLLDEAGFRNVTVTGDPALALRRAVVAAPPVGRRAVAINAGQSNGSMWGSEERALAAMASAAARLEKAGFEVRIFPVWSGDVAACYAMARAAGLPDDAVDPLILDPDAFLRYLDRFDVVIAIKLHAAVLAAAAGVPFVAIEYRPKVRDFTDSIGWDRFTFRSDAVEAEDLERAARELFVDLDGFRSLLDIRVSELAATFSAYATRMEEALLVP
jgi:polysaccharide pyruvyl transferase WcaK-like protein